MSPNFSDNTNMDTIDFKKLSEQLRSELLRVNGWRKVVRTGSIAVYLFVFCWFMFVLFGGALVSYIGLENYMQFTQYIIPVFIGFIVVNFVFTRCMTNFQERESEAMQHIMSTLFPTVYFSASSQVDSRILRDSKLFSASFSDPALAANTYGYIQFPHGEHSLHVADIGVSYGLLNKLQYNPVLGYFVMIYRFVLRPLFALRLDSSPHNFRGMFAWCKIDKRFKGNIIILPDHLEQKIGYLAKNIQGLKKRYSARLVQLEDQEFENYFAVYADDEVEARMLLTPAMMRHMTALRQTFGCDIMLSFSRGTFYYAAVMPSGFLCVRPSALNDGKLLEDIYNDISLSCKVAEELRLN